VIQAPWAGVDTLLGVFPPEVTLCDARGVHDIPTAEWAVTAILAMQKNMPFFVDRQREGKWTLGQQSNQVDRTKNRSPAFSGATFVRIGRTAHAGVEAVSNLDQVLPCADIVVLTIPFTSETRHLFDAKLLARMKPGALLVNASRGPIVETEALVQVLSERRIRAALDATNPEPLPEGHRLWKARNLLIMPHVAGDSDRFMQRAFLLTAGRWKGGKVCAGPRH
jgi:phosphoglycerate dehydrogenase-like enzyme